jgi:hypothetical protein
VESNRRNHYRILHVQPEAPEAVIRASYRTIMQRLRAHPDLGGDHRAAALLNEAYAVLTDPARRAAYDAELALHHARRARAASRGESRLREEPRRAATAHCAFCGKASAGSLQPDSRCTACASPLQPVSPGTLGAVGRALPRLERNHRALLYTRWPQAQGLPAEIRDLSPLGVRLVSGVALPERSLVKLDSDVCSAVLRVARVQRDPTDGRWIAGGAFVTVLFSQLRGGFVSLRA